MAHKRFEFTLEVLKDSGGSATLVPEIYTASIYHRSLKSLLETGELDEEMKKSLVKQGISPDRLV